jgi:ribosomal protein S18 acetylase RimI-like enzyme
VREAELAIVDELPAEGEFRYLEALATRADARRRGHARAVLQPGLERAEREGVTAALDADDPGVLEFYEKVGFKRHAEVRVPGAPVAWVMLREVP